MNNAAQAPKLFIPGPVAVAPATYAAMCGPAIGHRSGEFKKLYASVQPGLQQLFETTQPVYISTSSAWGVMEGALRNLCTPGEGRVLNCMNGAFSDKWHSVALSCGFQADALQFEWGQPICPEKLKTALSAGKYTCVTLIHCETSTGCLSNLPELMEVIRQFPNVYSVVDCVSSFSTVRIPLDALGMDVLLTGSQKALAMPPGLSLFAASARAHQRAEAVPTRGYYFNFKEFEKNHANDFTPATPNIPGIYALQHTVEKILAEGFENRIARHTTNNKLVHAWGQAHGFALLPEKAYAAPGLSCFVNDKAGQGPINLEALNSTLKAEHGMMINTGYGKLKGKTFRISNMGDETPETMQELLIALSSILSS